MLFVKTAEQNARAYCHVIGADPDEVVRGFQRDLWGVLHATDLPRWTFYVGAIVKERV